MELYVMVMSGYAVWLIMVYVLSEGHYLVESFQYNHACLGVLHVLSVV